MYEELDKLLNDYSGWMSDTLRIMKKANQSDMHLCMNLETGICRSVNCVLICPVDSILIGFLLMSGSWLSDCQKS